MSAPVLSRAIVGDAPRVLLEGDGAARIALVGERDFADLPELLVACDGDLAAVAVGESVEVGERLSVVGRPSKVVCIGLNYRRHAEESGAPIPAHPMLFAKWATTLTERPTADIPLPPESGFVDWEAELALIIGRRCRRVPRERAGDVVLGYTAANDVSMRDFQTHTTQFTAGKAWDRTTPIGPVIVPAAELGGVDPDLAIRGRLNGEIRQDSRTSDLIFSISELIAYVTTVMTLEPGDVVLTGTPSGVGNAADPPRSLVPGDVYEVELEGVGTLHNRFVREGEPDEDQ